jgi:metal-responsive CopG/Arc/MetJ family transcriptional regulator
MQRRIPTKELNDKNGRKLFSVNLSVETLAYLDELAKKSEMSRSGLVDLIIRDFRDNNRSITVTIGGEGAA